jgi:hypothetical protein
MSAEPGRRSSYGAKTQPQTTGRGVATEEGTVEGWDRYPGENRAHGRRRRRLDATGDVPDNPSDTRLVSFFYVFASVIVVGVLVQIRQTGDRAGLPFLVIWSVAVVIQGSWMLMRMPWRIQTDDRGIHFLARTRKIEVPWDRLRSVSSPWYDMNRVSIRWRWEGGRLRTMGPWEHQHRLLTTIEQRAPGVTIEGL